MGPQGYQSNLWLLEQLLEKTTNFCREPWLKQVNSRYFRAGGCMEHKRPPEGTIGALQGVAPAGLSAVLKIIEAWDLDDREQQAVLGLADARALARWRLGPPRKFRRDHLERLSHLLGIYRCLHMLLPDPSAANGWIKRPNSAPLFRGARALDLMCSGGIPGLFMVRRYLEEQVEGYFPRHP